MRRMFLVAPSLILAILAGSSAEPEACDCITLPALSPAVRTETPVIFSGRVVEIVERDEHTRTTYSAGAKAEIRPIDRQIVFEVRSAWNGVSEARFAVSSPISDCMFQFDIGRTYVVFAHRSQAGRVSTDRCTRTSPIDRATAILEVLGKPAFVAPAR
jgi:hypothetical protein